MSLRSKLIRMHESLRPQLLRILKEADGYGAFRQKAKSVSVQPDIFQTWAVRHDKVLGQVTDIDVPNKALIVVDSNKKTMQKIVSSLSQ